MNIHKYHSLQKSVKQYQQAQTVPLNTYPLLICSYNNRNHEDYEPNRRLHTLKYQIRNRPQIVYCKKDNLCDVKKDRNDTYD